MDHIGAWRIGLLLSLAHLGCGAKSPTQTIAFSATFGLESRTGSIVGQADSAANIWRAILTAATPRASTTPSTFG